MIDKLDNCDLDNLESSVTVPLPDESYLLALGDTTGFRPGEDSPRTNDDTRENDQMLSVSSDTISLPSDDGNESLICMRDIIDQFGLINGPDAERRFNEEGDNGSDDGIG